MSVYPKQKTTELLGLACLMCAFLLVLALYSYSPFDGSLNVSPAHSSYVNYIGRTGAWLSDFFLQLLGLPAFLVPLVLLLAGVRQLRGIQVEYPVVKTCGVLVMVMAMGAGLFLLQPSLQLGTDYTPGGVLGLLVGSALDSAFNRIGALIVVGFSLLFALVLTTRFSFEVLISWLSQQKWSPVQSFRQSYSAWKKRRHNRHNLRRYRQDEGEVLTPNPPRRFSADSRLPSPPVTTADRVEPTPDPVVQPVQPSELSAEVPSQSLRLDAESYEAPPLDILAEATGTLSVDEQDLMERARKLTDKCAEFDVRGRVLQIHPGPVVTTFEFKPDAGVKYSRVTNLVDDLCLAMRAEAIRIDRIPGKNTVGIEVPNRERQTIYLREILASTAFQRSNSKLTLGLGKLINGNTFVTDLARMPHLLIAGATGSGKSVAINCVVTSILYLASPEDVKFILIDPKRLELGLYSDIPHLLTPIVTNPKKASNALNWAVREMERRYKLLARASVRNLAQYNKFVAALGPEELEEGGHEFLPLIVIIVDELADLMMTAGKDVEASLTRLAQMARAIGIHLILATQRPSVDVITGLIKANFPSRISFRVSSKTDSRTVLDMNGAEQLLGQGDMLFLSPLTARPVRIHGAYVTERESERIASFLREQGSPNYQETILESDEESDGAVMDVQNLDDPLYDEAARFIVETRKASTSLLQRRLRIGYGRAARILDMAEHEGLIGPPDGSKPREVLVPPDYFTEIDGA